MSEHHRAGKAVLLARDLTIAWLSNPNTRTSAQDVPTFLNAMFVSVSSLLTPDDRSLPIETEPGDFTPAVTVRKSLANRDHIVSMIDGKPYKTLRRHLSANGLSPDEYRLRFNLKSDYPMVAESYSESRRALAKKIGLGHKPSQAGVDIDGVAASDGEAETSPTA